MVASGLHIVYLLMHNMISTIVLNFAQLVQVNVSHISGQHIEKLQVTLLNDLLSPEISKTSWLSCGFLENSLRLIQNGLCPLTLCKPIWPKTSQKTMVPMLENSSSLSQ